LEEGRGREEGGISPNIILLGSALTSLVSLPWSF